VEKKEIDEGEESTPPPPFFFVFLQHMNSRACNRAYRRILSFGQELSLKLAIGSQRLCNSVGKNTT